MNNEIIITQDGKELLSSPIKMFLYDSLIHHIEHFENRSPLEPLELDISFQMPNNTKEIFTITGYIMKHKIDLNQ